MATYQGYTASNCVPVTDVDAVAELLEVYGVEMFVDQSEWVRGQLRFAADATFSAENPGADEQATTEGFFIALGDYLPEDATLVVQSIGHERTRFPLNAYQYTVTEDDVEFVQLDPEGSL